jgi:UDP-N-acetylmuramate--alanine ligase
MTDLTGKRIFFIGIGGSGLSAIARLLLESGCTVSGSDRMLSPLAQELAEAGARVYAGHSAENVHDADLVIRSSAIPDSNVEVQAARAAGIPVLKRSDFLGQLMRDRLGIAVAGTHGKTTTTAMVAWLLARLGQDPSYIIGGTAKNLGGRNAHAGQGRAFVIEADEYDRMFLGLDPDVIVVSYLEHDHPDCFPTTEIYFQAFVDFVQRLRPNGLLLISADNPGAARLVGHAPTGARAMTYGTWPESDYHALKPTANPKGGFDFTAAFHEQPLAQVSLQVPGRHNAVNALAALAVIHQVLGEEFMPQAAVALSEFSGTGRRFDIQGEVGGVTVIDDYAHHPTEIQATLAAARARYPQRRIWAVWQPHTFSRTRALLSEFARSFSDADRVIVTEVYAAREKAEDFENFSAGELVAQMQHPGARFIPALRDVTATLLDDLQPGDVLLVLSAGDADQVSANVLAGLKGRSTPNA